MVQRLENAVLIQDESIVVMTESDKENSNFRFTHTASSHITPVSSNTTHSYLSYYLPCHELLPRRHFSSRHSVIYFKIKMETSSLLYSFCDQSITAQHTHLTRDVPRSAGSLNGTKK